MDTLDPTNFFHDGQGQFAHHCPSCTNTITSQVTPMALDAIQCPDCSTEYKLLSQIKTTGQSGYPTWQPAEVEVLWETYAQKPTSLIARNLRRTPGSINTKMSRLREERMPHLPYSQRNYKQQGVILKAQAEARQARNQ